MRIGAICLHIVLAQEELLRLFHGLRVASIDFGKHPSLAPLHGVYDEQFTKVLPVDQHLLSSPTTPRIHCLDHFLPVYGRGTQRGHGMEAGSTLDHFHGDDCSDVGFL